MHMNLQSVRARFLNCKVQSFTLLSFGTKKFEEIIDAKNLNFKAYVPIPGLGAKNTYQR